MKKTIFSLLAVALSTACLDMDVENLNAPDAERALAEADDVERLLGTGFYRWYNGTHKTSPMMGLEVLANTQTAAWGNFAMQHLGTQPRNSWDNSPTFNYGIFNRNPWGNIYEAISNVNDGLRAIDDLGLTFRNDAGENMNNRARAYAKFIQGVGHGWLALFYDQAFILDEAVNLEEGIPPLQPYPEVLDAAISYLDEAISIANSNTFQLPGGEDAWINGIAPTNQDLIVWANTYKARFLSGVGRTPADRAAADWNQIIQLARAGFHDNAPKGPLYDGNFWWHAPQYYATVGGWNRSAIDLVGMADTSGGYEAWKATDAADRTPFLIYTADRRVTGPEGPEDPGKYHMYVGGNIYPANRGMYFQSWYHTIRFNYIRAAGANVENIVIFTEAEMDLLEAEGLLRQGQKEAAIDLINKTRVANGELPPLPYSISTEEAFEQMIYEKLLETAMTSSGLTYFDKRGWGMLVCGTPLHFPVHGRELEQLQIPNYTFGGVGGDMAASQANGGCQP
jgi:hypothetical protein